MLDDSIIVEAGLAYFCEGSMPLQGNEEYLQIVLGGLNKAPREAIEAQLATDLTPDALHSSVTDQYIDMDRFQNYLVTYFDCPDFDALIRKGEGVATTLTFLTQPSHSEYSTKFHKTSAFRFEFVFCKFENVQDRTESGDFIQRTVFFLFEAIFEKISETRALATIRFPRLKKHPYVLYTYDFEAQTIENWCHDKLGIKLRYVDLKPFFESLSKKEYDKHGFEVSDIRRENNDIISAGFKISLPKKGQDTSAQMYAAIDGMVASDLGESLVSGFNQYAKNNGLFEMLPETASQFKDYLAIYPLSEAFFRLLHEACEYGIGYVRYTGDGDEQRQVRYNLEYLKNRSGLVRASHMKWNSFEPIFEEIKKFVGCL